MGNLGNRGVKSLKTLQSRDNILVGTGTGIRLAGRKGGGGGGVGRGRRGESDLKLYSILSASGRSNLQNSKARYNELSPLAKQTAIGV